MAGIGMSAKTILLETATGDDADYALDCFYRAYVENLEPEDGPPRPKEEIVRDVAQFLGPQYRPGLPLRLLGRGEEPAHEIFIAKDGNGERAGCLVLRINIDSGARVAWVYLIFVEPGARRRGIAREMVAKAEEWGRENRADFLMLNARACNRAAVSLYESAGLEPHHVWMRKRL